MSEGSNENHGEGELFPTADSEIRWLSYRLKVDFHPPIRLSRKSGLEFAAKIHSAMEVERATTEENEWLFQGAGVWNGMSVRVQPDTLTLNAVDPENGEEWYFERFQDILKIFGKSFEPGLVLESAAMANGLLQTSGDARAFLGGNLMFMHPRKLGPFSRPLHVLGVRFLFPATEDSAEAWSADVKAESWFDDPSKLYLQVDGIWEKPIPWKQDDGYGRQCAHVSTVVDFMKTNLLEFIRQPPIDEEDGENGPNSGGAPS